MTTSPVFSDRFNGRLALSAEHDQIRQIISTASEKRLQIDEKIVYFQAILDDLHLQRQLLDCHILEHRAMIAGIRKLPTEIMQAVFRNCLPARNAAMRADEAPLLLGRVCSTWRQIAYATPQLWSSLHICLPRMDGPHPSDLCVLPDDPVFRKLKEYGEAIEAWLYRASDTPLSISFSTKDHSSGTRSRDQKCSYILNILVRFCHNWKSFTLNDTSDPLAFEMLKSNEAECPLLETLVLDDAILGDHCWLLHAPSLQSVSLRRFSTLHYPWAHIANLTLGSWSGESESSIIISLGALKVLQSCPNLISCMLRVEVEEIPLGTGRVRLPSLEVLRVILSMDDWDSDDPNRDALAFFSCIEAPKLAHFGFKSINNTLPSVPFLSLFTGSNIIEAVEYEDLEILDALTDALALSPSIRRLRVIATGISPETYAEAYGDGFFEQDRFLTRISIDPSHDSHICPCLDEIEIELSKSGDISEQALLQFLLSRTDRVPPGVKCLRRARVVLHRHRNIDILPDLSRAIERGLQVEIVYRPLDLKVTYFPSSDLHLAADPAEWNREFLPNT